VVVVVVEKKPLSEKLSTPIAFVTWRIINGKAEEHWDPKE